MDATHDDIAALRSALEQAQARATVAEAEAARAVAQISSTEALIASLRLEIEKLRREIYGQRSERKARLLEQMEFQLEELEATASEDELAAEQAAAKTSAVKAVTRQRSSRKPFPDHLPRERVVVPAPSACACCGSTKLAKLGETITETLESIPRQWKVIQTVREKFTCRECEKITQPPAPFHTIPRGWAGPSLLAMILFEKFGQHQPLNRQCERFAREGVEVSLSTLADQVGTCAGVLKPLYGLIEAHVLAAERLHGDDTTVPVLAKGKTITGRLWTYVRDDRPFGGPAPPAAVFYYSRDRTGEHPSAICTLMLVSSRLMRMADTTSFMSRDASLAWCWKRRVGSTPAAGSLSWPIWLPAPGAKHRARRRPSSRRSPWRRSVASTPCLTSNARSMARTPVSAGPCARN
jgi:transposase